MRPRILLTLCLFGCLITVTDRVTAEEPDAAIQAKIEQGNQIWQQAMVAANAGKLDEATDLFEKVYQLEESVFGDAHSDLLSTLDVLSQVAEGKQDYDAVVGYRERQHTITEKLHGKDDYRTGDATHAVTNAKQQAELTPDQESQLAKADQLQSIVDKAYQSGNASEGIEAASERVQILKSVLRQQHPEYAISLNNLALLYNSMGDYVRAEPLYQEAMETRKSGLGKQHPDYAASLSNLAALYVSMGDYSRAEPLYQQAMEICKSVLDEQHPNHATSLGNLATLYFSMGEYAQAEPLYQQAMEIRKSVLGEQHPNYAASLNNLAELYLSMGHFAQAELMYQQTLEIKKSVLGEQHPSYATSLSNLAALYKTMGDYVQAESLCLQTINIEKSVLGMQHPSYASSLNNLAVLYQAMGDDAQAEPLYREAVAISLRSLELTADVQSERQQVQMGKTLRYQLDSYLSLAMQEPDFQEAAYAALLRWKGSVWQRQQRQRALIDQPQLKPRFRDLQNVSSRLSALILHPPGPKMRDAWHRQLDELTDQREKLERDLSLASVEFRQSQQPVTTDQLRESLPAGTMLIDFLEYIRFTELVMF